MLYITTNYLLLLYYYVLFIIIVVFCVYWRHLVFGIVFYAYMLQGINTTWQNPLLDSYHAQFHNL